MIALITTVLTACALPHVPPTRAPQRTGLVEVDAVITAMLGNNVAARRALVRFTTAACTTREGAGGPPKCKPDEAEGTPVEFLPILGPGEGSTIRKADVDKLLDVAVKSVYGVYRVKPDATREREYPAGDYAAIFLHQNNDGAIAVRVANGGIVRIDYLMTPDQGFQSDGAEWLIAPQER